MLINAVAPFAGAWIEIILSTFHKENRPVAPFAGAWIEISYNKWPMDKYNVAPFAGAWIEIVLQFPRLWDCKSLPSRERGLKLILRLHGKIGTKSLPSRERGLKSADPVQLRLPFCRSLRGSVDWNLKRDTPFDPEVVAPFAGAWIEIIFYAMDIMRMILSLPSRERGLKWNHSLFILCDSGRSLRGSVDWNSNRHW